MAVRLGEMLLHGGSLTEEQLEDALSAQSIYGGRLGTNLIEMGLLSEDNLARLLREKFGVPSVDAASLDALPAALVALIPREMAERFRVVPVSLDGKRLTLAMADPTDYKAIDEIGFISGFIVVPRVCCELRLAVALEHHYGIKRKIRFIPVEGGMRTRMSRITQEDFGLESAEDGPEAFFIESSAHPGQVACPEGNLGALSADRAGYQTPAGTAVALGHRGADCFQRGPSIEALAEIFAAASGESQVVMTLMSYLREQFDCAGFLSLKNLSAQGIHAVAESRVDLSSFAGWELDIENAALLKLVLRKKQLYLGRLPQGGPEELIQVRIGGRPGAPALLLPLVVSGASVAFILVEDRKGRLGPGLLDLQRVVAKAELALEMIGIRKKIGMV